MVNLASETRDARVRTSMRPTYKVVLRNRRALAMTETELKLIAALASIGLSSHPKMG